jgi:hypothetical protein
MIGTAVEAVQHRQKPRFQADSNVAAPDASTRTTASHGKESGACSPTAERIVAPSAIQPQAVAPPVSGLGVSCTSA